MLNDGDTVTFGKTVGKGSFMVAPVTARVELMYGSQSELIASTNFISRAQAVTSDGGANSRGSVSGRYGLYVPSSWPEGSSDDDSSSSRYGDDSDIEEINPQEENLAQSLIRSLQAGADREVHDDINLTSCLDIHRLPAFDESSERFRSHSPMDLASPTPSPVGPWPLPSCHVDEDRKSLSNHSSDASGDDDADDDAEGENDDERDAEGSDELSDPLFSEAASSQSSASSEVRSPADEVLCKTTLYPATGAESRSSSPPSEFDLHGREKEADANDQMSEMSAKMKETIARMHVSVIFPILLILVITFLST